MFAEKNTVVTRKHSDINSAEEQISESTTIKESILSLLTFNTGTNAGYYSFTGSELDLDLDVVTEPEENWDGLCSPTPPPSNCSRYDEYQWVKEVVEAEVSVEVEDLGAVAGAMPWLLRQVAILVLLVIGVRLIVATVLDLYLQYVSWHARRTREKYMEDQDRKAAERLKPALAREKMRISLLCSKYSCDFVKEMDTYMKKALSDLYHECITKIENDHDRQLDMLGRYTSFSNCLMAHGHRFLREEMDNIRLAFDVTITKMDKIT